MIHSSQGYGCTQAYCGHSSVSIIDIIGGSGSKAAGDGHGQSVAGNKSGCLVVPIDAFFEGEENVVLVLLPSAADAIHAVAGALSNRMCAVASITITGGFFCFILVLSFAFTHGSSKFAGISQYIISVQVQALFKIQEAVKSWMDLHFLHLHLLHASCISEFCNTSS